MHRRYIDGLCQAAGKLLEDGGPLRGRGVFVDRCFVHVAQGRNRKGSATHALHYSMLPYSLLMRCILYGFDRDAIGGTPHTPTPHLCYKRETLCVANMNICAVPCRLDQSAVLVAILRAKIIRLGKACGSRGQRCPRPAIVQSLIPKSKGVPIVPVTVSSGPSLLHPIPGSCAASAVITVCAVSILYLPWYLSSTASRQQLRVFRTFLTQPLPGASPSLLRAGAGPPTTVAQDRRIRVHVCGDGSIYNSRMPQ